MTAPGLIKAAQTGRSVTGFHTYSAKHMPAAFLVSMQFNLVMRILPRVKLYKPKKKRHFKWTRPLPPSS